MNINKNVKMDITKSIKGEKAAYNQLIVHAGKRSMLTFYQLLSCSGKLDLKENVQQVLTMLEKKLPLKSQEHQRENSQLTLNLKKSNAYGSLI